MAKKKAAEIGMRPYYHETDNKYVQYLFYSTYLGLVPRGVRLRLGSPLVIGSWLAMFALVFKVIPDMLSRWGYPRELLLGVRIAIIIASAIGGLLALMWYVDKFDISDRIMEGLENDLKNAGAYYRGEAGEKPLRGQFWVLTLNEEPVGCIGVDQTLKDVPDQRYSKNVSSSSSNGESSSSSAKDILFKAHKENEATLRRLAVKTDCQSNGLSTPLIKRVIFWAHSQTVETLYAETNELQDQAATILQTKYGFRFHAQEKSGLFRVKNVWKLDVKLWMSQELEKRAKEKELEDIRKEEEELKEYM
ncbi:uncharacterized protein BYT42DRAFT_547217 [Radiomyces spectabilis]|uniref:uncharacterized protein n=1 Tax=Radiomyces spectabilis TaxID=64574 RepID=UPI0022209372|nr:uncharacterized protein BYT42DRAFT_547217 [Radiomyces spectabilis]KAI8374119.1 hypothetical protein BYT42DRAFT_547217 [Radiomyces spectabilis]